MVMLRPCECLQLRPSHGRLPLSRPQSPSSLKSLARRKWRNLAATSDSVNSAPISRTQRIMESITNSVEVGGAGGGYSYEALKRLDTVLYNICHSTSDKKDVNEVVFTFPSSSEHLQIEERKVDTFDVLICGGTLGIFFAAALASKGLKVGVVEKNILKGREQEWNISRKELMELVHVDVLSEEDIDHVTSSKFNPNRCGFEGKGELWVEDILNLGVSPEKLLEIAKRRFLSLGGSIIEGSGLSKICIYDDIAISYLSDGRVFSSKLVVDAMGNFSPILKQIRRGKKPDGICIVVGSCCRGFKHNTTSDVIFSSSTVRTVNDSNVQYFWEAFPAGSGSTDRTTYMFSYMDPQQGSPGLENLLEEYWNLMPKYQEVNLEELEVLRVIFGIFPTYRDSPVPAAFNRVIQIGDASGIQSPVSFGGFGSMTRHLKRLSSGIHEAVVENLLDASSLSQLNPYMPNLRASWLFQRAMSAKHINASATFINDLLHANFVSMQKLGDPVIRPFLQDVIQFGPLTKTLGLVMLTQPWIIPLIFSQVGVGVILDWTGHFFMLGLYTFMSKVLDPAIRPLIEDLPPKQRFVWRRQLEAWKYGSGLDYEL
ncbi:lycopene beta/epsilon cyclase protein [Wolffia australiana]